MKDIFISHASEDKEDLVRPLVKELERYGVDIWYDEFELKLGDSLSASIDYGLANSSYGLLVLSPDFLKKEWTDYELKSLLTREVCIGKTILPIWHNLTKEQVMERSLYLADKKALKSDVGVKRLAVEIVKVIRPDILSFWVSRAVYRKEKERAPIADIHFSNIMKNDRVHSSLPFHMVASLAMFQSIFPHICEFNEMLDDFTRDVDYDTEYAMWVVIASAYIEVVRELNLLLSSDKSEEIFMYLLNVSMGRMEFSNYKHLQESDVTIVLQAYYRNASLVIPLLKKCEIL